MPLASVTMKDENDIVMLEHLQYFIKLGNHVASMGNTISKVANINMQPKNGKMPR